VSRLYEFDLNLCIRFNRISAYRSVESLFRLISRLGDGLFWYSLMLALPLIHGKPGWVATAHMLVAALPSLLIYRYLKRKTSRQRPCAVNPRIRQSTAPLDQFSFPSGHTLHAVCFTTVVYGHFPGTIWLLAPFSLLVALSRPILGLHYPSDVLAGAAIGMLVASLSRLVIPVS
jgi:undecaprenyl-diphosphatase